MTVTEMRYFEQPYAVHNGRETGLWIVGVMENANNKEQERVLFRISTDYLAGVCAILIESNYTIQGYSGSESERLRTIVVWREFE